VDAVSGRPRGGGLRSGPRRRPAQEVGGKSLRVAVHYQAADAPDESQISAFKALYGSRYNGCKLFGHCRTRGARLRPDASGRRPGHPDYIETPGLGPLKCEVGSGWFSPWFRPEKGLPRWAKAEGRVTSRCPRHSTDDSIWEAVLLWSDWYFLGGGPIEPGTIAEQDAWLVDAFRVLSTENDLVQAYHAERAAKANSPGE
jgi:hypothetical protein